MNQRVINFKSMKFPAFFLAPLLLLLVSCDSFKEPEFRRIENVTVSRVGLGSSTLLLNIHCFNPNKKKAKMKSAEGDVWVDNILLGHFSMDSTIKIPAMSDFSIPLKLKMDMGGFLKTSLGGYRNREVLLKMLGTARVGKGPVYINYPIKYEGMQRIDSLFGR
jgi:hypothetical protein